MALDELAVFLLDELFAFELEELFAFELEELFAFTLDELFDLVFELEIALGEDFVPTSTDSLLKISSEEDSIKSVVSEEERTVSLESMPTTSGDVAKTLSSFAPSQPTNAHKPNALKHNVPKNFFFISFTPLKSNYYFIPHS